MQRYYRKYYILKSYSDRCKFITIKALDNNDGYVNIEITINGKEVRQSLFLLGFEKQGSVVFKKEISSTLAIDKSSFDRVFCFAIILEKEDNCSLEYLQMEKQQAIIKNFEVYRFKTFSKKKQQTKSKSKMHETDSKKTKNNYNQKKQDSKKQEKINNPNQTQDLSDIMKTFSKASSMMNNFNGISNPPNSKEDKQIKSPTKQTINPFTNTFPNSEWIKTEFHGNSGYWHYLSGKIFKDNNLVYKAIAVPGEYSMTPPTWLDGFSRYYVCDAPYASGYWIMFTDPENGNVVSGPKTDA